MEKLSNIFSICFIIFVSCQEQKTEKGTTFINDNIDTIMIEQENSKAIIKKKKSPEDIYYLPKDSTIFLDYCGESCFRLFLGSDTTVFFKLDYATDNSYEFSVFYKDKYIGELYQNYDFDSKSFEPIEVWFENKPKIVPYGLAGKYFSFRLKEDED
jgi:hypothetical protein